MSKYGLKTLVTEHIPDLQIGTSGGGNLEIQELVPDKCLRNTQAKTIVLIYPWAPIAEYNNFYRDISGLSLALFQLYYAGSTAMAQFAPVYLEGDGIDTLGTIVTDSSSHYESLTPEDLTGFEEVPYEELGFKVVGLPILYPEPEFSFKSRSASAPSLSEMIERTRERFGLK